MAKATTVYAHLCTVLVIGSHKTKPELILLSIVSSW